MANSTNPVSSVVNPVNAVVNPVNLFDFDKADLEAFFLNNGEKRFRAAQVMKWIYHEGELNVDNWSNLSKVCRAFLNAETVLALPKIITAQHSSDGTIKWMLQLPNKPKQSGRGDHSLQNNRQSDCQNSRQPDDVNAKAVNPSDKNAIEMVFIPENDRGTLCISSQAGCALACPFCSTAHEGFNRNLTTAEIIGQVWLALSELGWQKGGKRKVTNIVLMGMGEPLMNYKAVVRACNLMMSDLGFGLSKRRVTLSTSGVVPKIYDLKRDSDVALAVSLHAPNDALRNQIVPINRSYPLEKLIAACRDFVADRDQKKHITWEYVMLKGVNDHLDHAKALFQLVNGIPGKINLIPFNIFPGATYEASEAAQITRFQNFLAQKGAVVTVRRTRGEDISAACGQLVGEVKDKSRRERLLVRHVGKIPIRKKTNNPSCYR